MVIKNRISVIVPAYQVEKYLLSCVKSILKQTYPNVEVIIVDDGSTDQSGYIAEELKRKDSRVKVIHQKNRGLSSARNAALISASGEWITFVDGDDCIHPQMLEILYQIALRKNADIVFCHFSPIKEVTAMDIQKRYTKIPTEILSPQRTIRNLFNKKSVYTVTACNKLYKRELWEGIYFPEGRIHEDVATTYKIFDRADRIIEVKLPLYGYLQRNDSIMSQKVSMEKLSLFETYDEMLDYFCEDERMMSRIVRMYRWTVYTLYAKSFLYWQNSDDKKEFFRRNIEARNRQISDHPIKIHIILILVILIKIKEILRRY